MIKKYFKDDVIQKTINFDFIEDSAVEKLNIAYGIDKNFLFGCGVSITSILIANPHTPLAFHIFTDSFCTEEHVRFEALAKRYSTKIVIYLVDSLQLRSLPSTKNWSYATYFRFIIADYFVEKVDKILYLDADIVCNNSLQELINFEFDADEVAGVVAEGQVEWWSKRAVSLATPGLVSGYFNAGFLMINIPNWALDDISRKAIEMLRDPDVLKRITHLDQDVLNILLVHKTRFLDKKYNTQFSLNYELKHDVINPVNENSVFIHFIGPTKPWHQWGNYPVSYTFLKAKSLSPWDNVSLLKPKGSHQMRYAAKHMFNQRKYFSGTINYLHYFKCKLLK